MIRLFIIRLTTKDTKSTKWMRLSCLLFFALFMACNSKKPPADIKSVAELPDLKVRYLTGDSTNINTFRGKTILMFYSPDCDHCQREAKDIGEHATDFKEYSLYFICAPYHKDNIESFRKEYGLVDKPNFHFLTAEIEDVIRTMGSIGTPTLYIYSDVGKLVRRVDNETKAEEIIGYLN